jgi:predicted PurR-regulated permease PerM
MERERSPLERARPVPLVIAATTTVAFVVVVFALAPEVPFVIFAGVLLALFVRMPSVWLASKTGLRYWAAAAVVWLAMLAATALVVWAVGPDIVEQVRLLSSRMPTTAHRIFHRLQHPPGWMREFFDPPSAASLRPEPSSVVSGATDVVVALTVLLGGVVVVFFIGLYGSLSPGSYTRAVVALAPRRQRPRVEGVMGDMADALGRWLVGRMVAMAFVGIFSGIGLWLLGVPLALALGIVAGLLTFVEYLGAVVSAVPAALLALTLGPLQVVWVMLLYLGVHIVEGYVLTPLIARQAVRFPPAYTLTAQLVFGGLFGVLGLTFATPLCVVFVILVTSWHGHAHTQAPSGS